MTDKDLYFGGMPTGPDIKKLDDHWPNVKKQDEFASSEIAEVIDVLVKSQRFITVKNAWRKKLQSRGYVTICIKNKSLLVLNNKQTIGGTYDDMESKLRDHAAMLCYMLEKNTEETKNKVLSPKVTILPRTQK